MGNEQTGVEAILEQQEREKAAHRKTITVRTTREPNCDRDGRFFPADMNYLCHISEITFSNHIGDYKGTGHKNLTLITRWYSLEHPYWSQWLNDERGTTLIMRKEAFSNELSEPFMNYSEQRLREFQECGLNAHKSVIERLETLYYQPGEVQIPENLLEE